MKLLESVNNCSVSMSFSVGIFMFQNLTLSNFSIIYCLCKYFLQGLQDNKKKKKERNAVFKLCLFFKFVLGFGFLWVWWLGVFFFPSHLLAGHDPAPLAPAGVCITEKHNSVGPVLPLAERFCIVLVTTKIKFTQVRLSIKEDFLGGCDITWSKSRRCLPSGKGRNAHQRVPFWNASHPHSHGEGIRWWDLLGLKSLIQDTLKAARGCCQGA